MKKKPFDRSDWTKQMHANRTPEQKAATSKKTSESIKKWHREMSAKKIQERNRKISATTIQRHSERPPRYKRDLSKKKSESFHKFDKTLEGREQRKYIGYLSSKDILECPLERKKRIVEKRNSGHRRYWANLPPEEKEKRIKESTKHSRIRSQRISCFYEKDVPREKTYCGVLVEEKECMNG